MIILKISHTILSCEFEHFMSNFLLGEASAFEHPHKNNIQKREKSMHDAISLCKNVSKVDTCTFNFIFAMFKNENIKNILTLFYHVNLNTL